LGLLRFGWGNVQVCALGAAALAVALWWTPHAQGELASRQRALARATKELNAANDKDMAPPVSSNEQRLNGFYRALGERRYAEQQVKTLFAVAAKTNLSLNQADYRQAFDKSGQFHTYQVTLPVKGSYGAIRQFCDQVLLAIPFASLDQMNFKRDAIGSNLVEAQLRFTFYLTDPTPGISQHGNEREAAE
jgi:hypothetical protein